MTTRPGRKTSVYLPADLAARVAATDVPLSAVIARGLDCTGHTGNPIEQLRVRLDAIEQRQADHEQQHPAACHHQAEALIHAGLLTRWASELAHHAAEPVTSHSAAQTWGIQVPSARKRLAQLAAAGHVRELPALPRHAGRSPRRWQLTGDLQHQQPAAGE
jgi:hypothetical protein